MTAMLNMVLRDRDAWKAEAVKFETALRRIRSLEEKNVGKYAQQIAKEALSPPNRTET